MDHRRGPHRTQVTESGSCERAAVDMANFPEERSQWISERFLSREGSGEADRRIPGAHEAFGKLFVDGSSTALKDGFVGKLSRHLVMQRNRLTSCDANPRPGMKHSFQFDHLSALFRPFPLPFAS